MKGQVPEHRLALADGTIAAAGLDVFEQEPLPADSRLAALDNVILSNHLARYTEERPWYWPRRRRATSARCYPGAHRSYPVNRIE